MRNFTQAHKLTSSQAHKSDLSLGIGGKEKVPIYNKSVLGYRNLLKNVFMILFLGLVSLSSQTMQAQVGCPDWSICVEVDPNNCNELRVTLNGVASEPILATNFYVYLNDPALTINGLATTNSFQSTAFGMHPYWGSNPLQVNPNQIRLTYAAPFDPFTSSEDCIHLGNIVFNPPEGDCHDFDLNSVTLGAYGTGTGTNTPLIIGDNFLSNPPPLFCNVLTLDCPCSEDVCSDWGICFLETGECDRVRVGITGLDGEDLAGLKLTVTLDPNITQIDEVATETSYLNSGIGGHMADVNQIIFNGNQFSITFADYTGSYPVQNAFELLMDIYFEAAPGQCYSFSESTLSFGLTGIRLGDNFFDAEFCDGFPGLSCPDFEICCESVTLSGNVLRPPSGDACDEGVNYGFPGGSVNISSTTGYFNKTVLTDPDGDYEVEVFPNQTYSVTPDYTSDFLDDCGVNTADIDEIRKVILGVVNCFNLDVGNAAADVDGVNNINTLDILLVDQIILGTQSPSVKTWRFMTNSDYLTTYAPQICPAIFVPPYDEQDIVTMGTLPRNNINFKAIKMGDVDGTCTECIDPNALTGGRDIDLLAKWDKDNNVLEFSLDDPLLEGITVLAAVVNGSGLRDQVSMTFSPDDELLVGGRGSNGVGMVWSSTTRYGVSLDQDQTIMEIPLDISIQRLSDLNLELSVGEMMMNGQRYLFNLIVEEKESQSDRGSWSVHPNPASDVINLKSYDRQGAGYDMDIEIINTNGQTVYLKENVNMHRDGNRISIRELNSGMYILRLRTSDEEVQLPFVKIRP